MAEKISELTGEARAKRIAELKAKMQAAAVKAKAAHAAAAGAPAASKPAKAAETAPAQAEPPAQAAVAVAEKPAAPKPARTETRAEAPATNGAAAAAKPVPKPAPKPAPKPKEEAEPVAAGPSVEEMNRREFLTYAWGAALGLLTLQAGVASFLFMYPRFRAGEFGGKFFLSPGEVPGPGLPPVAVTDGKFWLVTTDEGEPKALYMVCTHLGCLYKWESSNNRFECPCHGSKFTHDGHFIEGPAPRSLDYFELTIEDNQVVVDTGRRIQGAPAAESPARVVL